MAANQSNKRKVSGGGKPGARKVANGKAGRASHAPAQGGKAPILDDKSRRDIAAVVLVVLAVALFATAVLSPSGVVTGALATALRFCLGIGVYVLPFILVGIALTFVVRFNHERVPARVAIGLALLFVAFLVIVSLTTPGCADEPNNLFIQQYLVVHGGYIGAGIAWALLELFGLTVSLILMGGLVIVALVVIGFSISSLVERLRTRAASEGEEGETGFEHMPRFSMARVRKGGAQNQAVDPLEAENSAAETRVSPAVGSDTSNAVTQIIGSASGGTSSPSAGSASDKPKTMHLHRGNHAPLNQNDTIVLDGGKARQMTRKLGSRPVAADADGEAVADAAAAASANSPVAAAAGTTQKRARKKPVSSASPAPTEGFELPSMDLLKTSGNRNHSAESEAQLRNTALRLQETLADFGVNAEVVDWVAGPTVTLFKIDLPPGVRVSRVSNLNDDIALALASPGVRIFAPVPGTNYVGIEVPNKKRETVLLGDVIKDAPAGPLQVAIGKDVEGQNIISDLAKMPHLLIGGTTGSGKSVSINGMIMSILMRATPSEVRMIMIDPKRVEFTPYNDIPHLYVPVVTEPKEAASALAWAVAEMERRLKVFSSIGARNIGQYNAKAQAGFDIEGTTAVEMPYIVIIIDELADLMMNVGKEVEFSISRLAQLARAAGIHLIVATQRPSTNVVTGLIKANITNRIAFNVASGIDSRVILDTPGAENLIGLGDLLLSKPELAKPQRIQGCFVSEEEIEAVVEKLKEQGEPEYHHDILKTNLITLGDSSPDGSGGTASSSDDPLVWDAAEIVVSSGMGSTSNLQRRLSVGYSRAGRLMDLLEEKGIVGPPNGSKPREVLIDNPLDLETLKAFEQHDSDEA